MAILVDDLAPPRRFSLATAIRRNPTIAFGGVLLAALIVMAVLAPRHRHQRSVQDRAGQPAAAALGALVVRHRPVRPRRLLAHRLWRARLADRGPLRRRLLEPARSGHRPRLRLLPPARWPGHAGDGRADGDPLDPARHRPHHPDAARPRHRDRGHRHPRGAAGRARGARGRALHPLAALYRKRPSPAARGTRNFCCATCCPPPWRR